MGTDVPGGNIRLEPGRVVQAWAVEEELGRGAMAVVYRVRHRELGTVAALKVLEKVDPTTERRLLAEGRAQGSVHHPGIVGVLDFLRVDEHAALLLEYVPGRDLAALLRERPLSLDDALDLFGMIAAAVGAAHAAGLVHRDLKPSNVLVTGPGLGRYVAKVGDFGLVKSEDADLTASHAMIGTPRYMAPEQMRTARRVDARADVFALGGILYELVCGRPAFPGEDLVDLYVAKTGGRYADPTELVSDLPAPVVTAIRGALQGAPSRRIPSCQTLLAVLAGAPWSGESADRTFDGTLDARVCPRCGASASEETCGACGSPTTLGGRWQLVDVLSEGPRTRVFRGVDLETGRWVAVRALLEPEGALGERFRRGVRVTRELDHPQIPRLVAGPFDELGRCWEVRELVEGRALSEELLEHRFAEVEVLEVLVDLAPVLAYLAERSPPVVHRAVRPENVLRAEDGRLVLVDFARVRDEVAAASLGSSAPDAAPEEFVGDATPATDVHGLGGLAATLLTRRRAAELLGPSGVALGAHAHVSDGFAGLLREMLAADPAARPTAGEVGRRAAALAIAARAPVPPAPLSRRRTGLAVAAAAAVLVGLGLAWGPIGEAWDQILTTRPVSWWAMKLSHAPVAVEMAPDLVGRPLDTSPCSEEPVTIDVAVGGRAFDGPVPILAKSRCDLVWRRIGEGRVGQVVPVEVPAGAWLAIPHAPHVCRRDGEPVPCTADGPIELVLPDRGRYAIEVRDAMGSRLTGAVVRFEERHDDVSIDVITDETGVAEFPWGFAGAGERERVVNVTVDGALGQVPVDTRTTDHLVVSVDGAIVRARVIDPAGAPLAGARVYANPMANISDAQLLTGIVTGSLQTGGPHYWLEATSDADGRVAFRVPPQDRILLSAKLAGYVFASTSGDDVRQVRMVPARRWFVGCAGLPGDRCEGGVDLPDCNDAPPMADDGQCRRRPTATGSVVECECHPETRTIRLPGVATVQLPSEGEHVWFDLRDLLGGIQGRIPEGPRRDGCNVRAEGVGTDGMLQAISDTDGRFTIRAVPAGKWRVTATCSGWHGADVVDVEDDVVTATLQPL